MLKQEDSDRLTKVGPGTPGGTLLRRYWLPILLSREVAEPDGAPVRVRHLGEDLLAFRASDGRIGLVDAFCPHRRAPLFFGRNEECGIRCAYHGWKFDVSGTCVDMPSEPAGSSLQDKVKLLSYPTVELGGVIWAYLGPSEHQPPPPDYEWLRAPDTHRWVSKTFEHCNYLQALEGGLDTTHSSFAHNNRLGDKNMVRQQDRSPRLDVEVTDYGYQYVSTRSIDDDRQYVRVYHYIMPTQQVRGNITHREGHRSKLPKMDGHIWVPIDDEHTFVYNWMLSYSHDYPIPSDEAVRLETEAGRGPDDHIPGTFKLRQNLSNDYLIDRQMQKTETFTGIRGINTQDFALQEGMGPIVDRSREHLGHSDRAIVAMRRLMLQATHALEDGDSAWPRGADPLHHRGVRAYDDYLKKGDDWRQKFSRDLAARF